EELDRVDLLLPGRQQVLCKGSSKNWRHFVRDYNPLDNALAGDHSPGLTEFKVSPCEHLSRANEYGLMVMEETRHFLVVGDDEHPICG
ncbi:hypothetical protein V6N11_073145, partial [Hibiscus sabdariffa]